MQPFSNVLKSFPKLKLSCETVVHNKVYSADFMMLCPVGIRGFMWFTTVESKNVCLFLELAHEDLSKGIVKIKNVKQMYCYYDCNLNQEHGTILYGTLFNHVEHTFFSMEDVFYYKGQHVGNSTWIEKMALFQEFLVHDTVQRFYKYTKYKGDSFVFGLPIVCTQYSEINPFFELDLDLKYDIQNIQFYNYCKKNTFESLNAEFYKTHILNPAPQVAVPVVVQPQVSQSKPFSFSQLKLPVQKSIKHLEKEKGNVQTQFQPSQQVLQVQQPLTQRKERELIFKVKPDIQNDVYHLYCHDPTSADKLAYYDIACIPDYKTSVFMNKLFRIIKENDNLDALEESDDEEEFENEKEDRFVFLDKVIHMACVYNYKFKKWTPIRVEDAYKKIANKYELAKYHKSQFGM